jgi:hypothetical protein
VIVMPARAQVDASIDFPDARVPAPAMDAAPRDVPDGGVLGDGVADVAAREGVTTTPASPSLPPANETPAAPSSARRSESPAPTQTPTASRVALPRDASWEGCERSSAAGPCGSTWLFGRATLGAR